MLCKYSQLLQAGEDLRQGPSNSKPKKKRTSAVPSFLSRSNGFMLQAGSLPEAVFILPEAGPSSVYLPHR